MQQEKNPYPIKPALIRRRRQAAALSLALGTGLALLISGCFYLYGEFSSKMNNPAALQIGLFAGGLNLLIFSLVQARRLLARSWAGLVIDKSAEVKDQNTIYTILVQGPAGKKRRVHFPNDAEKYAYYKLGDPVYYHPGWNHLEKVDKTADSFTFCSNCGFKCKLDDEFCAK